jgi:hypothetical protein
MNLAVVGVNVDTGGRLLQVFVRRPGEWDERLLTRVAAFVRLSGHLSHGKLAFRCYAVEAEGAREAQSEIASRYDGA